MDTDAKKTEIEVAAPPPTPTEVIPNENGDIIVVARNSQQMAHAQAHLIEWAIRKIEIEKTEHAEIQNNLAIATKNHWNTAMLKRHAARALKRVEFYEKIKLALEAGHVIIPNFDIDIFAIRTTRESPRREMTRWSMEPLKAESPPAGEGEFVDSRTSDSREIENTGTEEKPNKVTWLTREDFREVDFPFALARPEVLNATERAMADKFFDTLGISPARTMRRRGDPMVIGRITRREGGQEHNVSFLITWFLNTADL